MHGYKNNSEWERRMRELLTDRGLVGAALGNERAFRKLVAGYRPAVLDYLKGILSRQKLAADDAAAEEAAAAIWNWMLGTLPARLAEEWSRGGKSFRLLLREGVHEACSSWSKPATRKLMQPVPDEGAWNHEMRRAFLSNARQKLKSYQRENQARGTLYHTIFRIWEDHPDESLDALNGRLAALPGGRRLEPTAFRKALSRARDLFGRYLSEEVAAWIAERDCPSPEKYRQAFEDLDLMNDYAAKSKHCRWLLGMDEEDAE